MKEGKMRVKITIILFICLNLILCASAQKKLAQARAEDPQYQYNIGLVYLNNGKINEAILYFNKSLYLNPRFDLALNALGLAYFMQGSFEQSLKYFQKCLEVNPNLTEAHNYIGSVYQEMGIIDKAEQEFRRAIADKTYKSRELPYYNLARLYFLKDKLQDALDFVEISIEINNRMVLAHNLKGVLLEKLEKFEEAIQSYKKALKIVPDDINLKFNLASAYFKNGEITKAKEIFEEIRPKATDLELREKINQYLKLIKK